MAAQRSGLTQALGLTGESMDSAILAAGVMLALSGLAATATALLHRSPGQSRVIRFLTWPGIKPTDRIALPLGLTFTCFGIVFALTSLPGSPNPWVVLPILAIGMISAVFLGIRRSET